MKKAPLLIPFLAALPFLIGPWAHALPPRAAEGLLVHYDFQSLENGRIPDRSGHLPPIHLRVADPRAIHLTPGRLEFLPSTQARSEASATRIADAIRISGRLTLEAWIQSSDLQQSGPARILTFSSGSSVRNVTLGQDGRRWDVRLRTTRTSDNGIPSTASRPDTVTTNLTHLVFTRDRYGRTRLYLDGQLHSEQTLPGSTVNWDGSYRLALGNELSGDRPWRGSFHLVALYQRDLLPEEIERHYHAGPHAPAPPPPLPTDLSPAPDFAREIAPLFSRHCLECHDTASRRGRLDLSQKHSALADIRGQPMILPGNPDESPLWMAIASDAMPEDRPPLNPAEKAMVRSWIQHGAPWTLDTLDPAAHRQSRESSSPLLRRLTLPEYVATIQQTLGLDIQSDAAQLLPPDLRADGFRNTAYNLGVDLRYIEAQAELAQRIVHRLDLPAFLTRFTTHSELTPDQLPPLIGQIGRRLLRSPLDSAETLAFTRVADRALARGGTPLDAMAATLEAMLQAPQFLYRIENQRGDGTSWPVEDHELAVRLSYLYWGAPADEELFRALDAGELYDPRHLAPHLDRLQNDPRTRARSLVFANEWLDLDRLDHLQPHPQRFPHWSPELAADLKRETLAFFEEVIWKQRRPLPDLLNAQVTVISPRLASFYGLPPHPTPAPTLAPAPTPTLYDLQAVPERGGLLTQASLLTMGGDEASMVARGLFVLNDLLRGAVNNPPAGLDTRPVPAQPGLSRRAAAQQRIDNPSCSACHVRFETLAFAFEKFDGIGAFHTRDEHGNDLREDGEILFPGDPHPVPFQSIGELQDLLAKHPRVQENLTRKVIQFAIGRPLTAADAATVSSIHQAATAQGGTYPAILRTLALSPLVLRTPTEPDDHPPSLAQSLP